VRGVKSLAMMLAILLIRGAPFDQNSANFKIVARKFIEYTESGKSSFNTHTIDNLGSIFAGATNVIRTRDKHDVERVYFETKGNTTLAAFNKRGHFLYSITSYPEEMLRKDILCMVKKNYYGRHIFGVTEVNTLNKTAYLIMLDPATAWLHIKVLDDELTEEKVMLKPN
jgi:hypothetical protein